MQELINQNVLKQMLLGFIIVFAKKKVMTCASELDNSHLKNLP